MLIDCKALEKLNLDTLGNDNNSYIDETLQEYYSDIVYNCEYNGDTTMNIWKNV